MKTVLIILGVLAGLFLLGLVVVSVCYGISAARNRILSKLFSLSVPSRSDSETLRDTVKRSDIAYDSPYDRSHFDLYEVRERSHTARVVLWVHGGGFIGGDKAIAEDWCRRLARATGAVTVSMNYALAPRTKYPAPILQIDALLCHLAQHAKDYRIDLSDLILCGDSAGAQIVSQYAAMRTNEVLLKKMGLQTFMDAPRVGGLMLFCGLYHMDTVHKTRFPSLGTCLSLYTGVKRYRKYTRLDELSTVRHITKDYPPVFVTCGNRDPLCLQTHELVDALSANDVTYRALLMDDSRKKLWHEYQFKTDNEDAKHAFREAVDFIHAIYDGHIRP